jgi:hypothetical protein
MTVYAHSKRTSDASYSLTRVAYAYAARPGCWEYLARDGEIRELMGRRET